jgi:hypothetical protein
MPPHSVDCSRIRFTPEPVSAGLPVRRRFREPRAVAALQESVDPGSLPAVVPTNELYLLRSPESGAAAGWMETNDGSQCITLKLPAGAAYWRRGRAAVEGAEASNEVLLDTLIEFAFLEGELRESEQALLPYENAAPADVPLAFQIRATSQPEWERLGQTLESLSRMRLRFTRLEPCLATASPWRDYPELRRVFTRLAIRSGVPARLEAFGDRLKTLEDLYEGAVDRITDFQAYRRTERLEIIIIVILVVETIAVIIALFVRP